MKTTDEKTEDSGSITGQLAGSVKEGFTNVYDALTGRGLEKKLDEYTDVYGHLLLLHEEEIRKLHEENERLREEVGTIRGQGRVAVLLSLLAALAAAALLFANFYLHK